MASMYGCEIEVISVFMVWAKILIANRIALVVLDALSFKLRHNPTRLSIYPSTQPNLGRFRFTSTGNAGAKGIELGIITGCGIDSCDGFLAWFSLSFQNGLLIMSLAKSVNNSINIHHSAGLKDPPNISLRYMRAHIFVEQMYFTAVVALRCILLYVQARSSLHINIVVFGYANLIAWIMCITRMNMKP